MNVLFGEGKTAVKMGQRHENTESRFERQEESHKKNCMKPQNPHQSHTEKLVGNQTLIGENNRRQLLKLCSRTTPSGARNNNEPACCSSFDDID